MTSLRDLMNTSREANCEGGVQTLLSCVYYLSHFQVCLCVLTREAIKHQTQHRSDMR